LGFFSGDIPSKVLKWNALDVWTSPFEIPSPKPLYSGVMHASISSRVGFPAIDSLVSNTTFGGGPRSSRSCTQMGLRRRSDLCRRREITGPPGRGEKPHEFESVSPPVGLLFVPLVFTDMARAQEQHFPARAPAADIVKDNLSRTAATPEQILEVLNKDPGLTVEFKQVLAKDAGINGQILIEADLTEAAIAERLHSDLHSRTLATGLLRRYGYLVPRINPDSDLAAEHNLVLRERSQEIQRATERRGLTQEQTRTERTGGCNPKSDDSCLPVEIPPSGDGRPAMQSPPEQRIAPPALRATDGETPNNLPFDAFTNDGEGTASPALLSKSQSVLASERQPMACRSQSESASTSLKG
jgi:hypothetical protein